MTPEERAANGRAARAGLPRTALGALETSPGRDPVAILAEQDATRVAELVPIRYGRMLASEFAFFRGAAAVMAHDLEQHPSTGLRTQLSGDAHLLNFGGFGSPERDLVFDLNDFDETRPGPFEWDVKRFAASIEIAGRDRGFSRADRGNVVRAGARAYREAMRDFAAMGDLDVWYSRLDATEMLDVLKREHNVQVARDVEHIIQRARRNDGRRALSTLTTADAAGLHFVHDPPLLVPVSEMAPDVASSVESSVAEITRSYRASLAADRRVLLDRFTRVDIARKVVGIGSVGTECWVVLLVGRDADDPLFLQVKEAKTGRRVVEGQRLMQAASDIFLGWSRDFYVRQLRDWKVSLDVEAVGLEGFAYYVRACGWTLARAHARAGDRIAIAAYLGGSDRFDRAVGEFASAYADLNARDHRALQQAVTDGRVRAAEGV